jgi:hypothetical protein
MSDPDFRNGLAIPELDQELSEKALEIREFMKEETNNRKRGKAETGRLALILGHKYLKDLEREEEDKKEELAKYYHRVDQIVEEIR